MGERTDSEGHVTEVDAMQPMFNVRSPSAGSALVRSRSDCCGSTRTRARCDKTLSKSFGGS